MILDLMLIFLIFFFKGAAVHPRLFVTVYPQSSHLLRIGAGQKFTAHVIGNIGADNTVTWMVNGIVGGNSTYGTIGPDGYWTSPSNVPADPVITITATSNQDSRRSASVKARIIPTVTMPCSPEVRLTRCYTASATLHVNESHRFSAAVKGVSDSAVVWAVNSVVGGNAKVGTITNNGLYTAPGEVPEYGMVAVTATSRADLNAVAVANVTIYPPKFFRIYPSTIPVLPGWFVPFQYYTDVYYPSDASSYRQLVSWLAKSGTFLDNRGNENPHTGVYKSPASPGQDEVTARSVVDGTFSATAKVTVTSHAGPTVVGLLDTWTKVRPYDIVSPSPSLTVAAAQQQYASWQVVIEAQGEDLSTVDVTVSNFTDGAGHMISTSANAVIYFQRMLNVFYPSRLQGSTIGEYPDPLVPKIDPFVRQARNAFPFSVNRISRCYQQYPQRNGTTRAYLGTGSATSGGTYADTTVRQYIVTIDSTSKGTETGKATFKWSDDAGKTYQGGVLTSTTPIPLSHGVTVSFSDGRTSPSFAVGQTWWIWAGPLRNQPIWIDLYVPTGQAPGKYTGTVTVSAQGKPAKVLAIELQVYGFSIPITSSIPSWFGGYWPALKTFHQGGSGQDNSLAHRYAAAALINRITYGGSQEAPNFTYAPDGSVLTADYFTYDSSLKCLAVGRCTVHGERSTSVILLLSGSNDTQRYYSTADQIDHHKAWGPNLLFDYTKDEPGSPSDYATILTRGSLMRSVNNNFPVLVTTNLSNDNYQLIGTVNRWVPNWGVLGEKEYQRGSNAYSRAAYDYLIPKTDNIWWYDSCQTHGCGGPGGNPYNDNWLSMAGIDLPSVVNQAFGFAGLVPYRVAGLLYYDMDQAIQNTNNMGPRSVDPLDSVYYFAGNGDGTFFYPGCATTGKGNCAYAIGGSTDIGLESLRLKYIRDAMVDMEYGLKLISQGNSSLLTTQIGAVVQDNYTYDPNPTAWAKLRKEIGAAIK